MTSTDIETTEGVTDVAEDRPEPIAKPRVKVKKDTKSSPKADGKKAKDKPKDKPSPKPEKAVGKPAPAPAAEADVPGSRPLAGRPVAYGAAGLVFALLVAAVVVLVVRTVSDHVTIQRQHRVDSARSSVLAAAKRYAIDFTTYDYRNLDAGFRRTEAELTGDFKTKYTSTTAALKQTIVKYEAKATSVLQAIAVQSVTPTDATVIAFVDQTITNTTSTTPQVDRNRMLMTLHRAGSGPWLITDLQLP